MKKRKLGDFLLPLVPLLMTSALLEVGSRSGLLPAFLFASPSQVLSEILTQPGSFLRALKETALGASLGLVLACLFGLSTALLISYSDFIRKMFYPYAIFFQTVPIIAVAPLLVIWFGYGMPTVVAASFIVSVFPVIANGVMGLGSVSPELSALFELLEAGSFATLVRLRLPSAVPQILGGIKIAAGLSVIGAIVGEFISGSGLGGLVDEARNQQRVDRVFAAVLLSALLGALFFFVISFFEKAILKKMKFIK